MLSAEADIVTARPTKKLLELAKEPAGVITVIGPVEAPAGNVAKIEEEPKTLKVAGVPLKRTDVAPSKLAPLIVTLSPARP